MILAIASEDEEVRSEPKERAAVPAAPEKGHLHAGATGPVDRRNLEGGGPKLRQPGDRQPHYHTTLRLLQLQEQEEFPRWTHYHGHRHAQGASAFQGALAGSSLILSQGASSHPSLAKG